MTDNEKILARIKKLFALGSNNPNSNEAENAIRMAKKLLDKHNFSMYQLQDKEKVGIKIEDYVCSPWVRIVYGSVCRLFDSKYIIDKTVRPHQHLIVGTESNRVTASIIVDYVLKKIRKEFTGCGAAARNGAAKGVQDQVNAILAKRNASREEIVPGTGLVPMDATRMAFEDINAFVARAIEGITNKKSSRISMNYSTRSFGRNINLNTQLSNKRALN